jgi:hypothetical protein
MSKPIYTQEDFEALTRYYEWAIEMREKTVRCILTDTPSLKEFRARDRDAWALREPEDPRTRLSLKAAQQKEKA